MQRKKLRVVLLCSMLFLTLLVFGVAAVVSSSQTDTIFPNMMAGELSIEGMTEQEAYEFLKDNQWDENAKQPLTVKTFGGQSFQIDPLQTGLRHNAEETARFASQYGKTGSRLQRALIWLQLHTGKVDVQQIMRDVDLLYISNCIKDHEAELNDLLGNDELVSDLDAGELRGIKGWGQLKLDRKELSDAIVEAIIAEKTKISGAMLEKKLVCPDFAKIYDVLAVKPENAHYSTDNRFTVIPEVDSVQFDTVAAVEQWEKAEPLETFSVPLQIVRPEITTEELQGRLYRDLLGACTTNFVEANENQSHNITMACEKLNGIILYPGDIFSFNESVGERTEASGFLPAPAISNGEVVDEIGGRVCQVSSTIYAASIFAFLETVERENHYFPVNYMQLGTDAAVTIPAEGRVLDFRFRNSRQWPIRLDISCDPKNRTVTCEIRGTLEDNDYMPVEFDNSWGWQYTFDRVIEPADPNRPGYKIKLDHESYYFSDHTGEGVRTLTHRLVYDAEGSMVADEIVNLRLSNGKHAMDTYYDPMP